MYMDDIKLFAKNEKELETLIHTVRIYSQDIGMGFGIEKCALLRTLAENETYKYWHHQTSQNEKQNSKRITQN